jgi:four helix bundle protein
MKETPSHKGYDLEDRVIDFAVSIIGVVESLPKTRAAKHIVGQLLRSGTAAAPNYGEAQAAESRRDFIHKMKLSLKELQETRVWIRILQRSGYEKPQGSLGSTLSECQELILIFSKSIATARANRKSTTRKRSVEY